MSDKRIIDLSNTATETTDTDLVYLASNVAGSFADFKVTPERLTSKTDNQKQYFGTSDDVEQYYDGTDMIIHSNAAGTASDLVIDCGTEKTLELSEPVWEDIVISLSGAKVPAANTPTWATFTTNTGAYTFDINDYIDINANEMLHGWAEGTEIELHIHWANNGVDGTERAVKWMTYWCWANVGSQFTESNASSEATIAASLPDKTHIYSDIVEIDGSGFDIGSIGVLRLKRVAAAGTDPSSDPFALMVGIHYQKNTMGSRTELIK